MIIISIIGIVVNFLAAYKTREGDSLNQKSVNLHMLEDVLGWVIVFIGSILMKFTDITYIDSIMSIIIAIYILIHALENLKSVLDLFLVKTPKNVDIDELKKELLKVKNVSDIHHIHVWSMDGVNNYATIHAVINTKDFEKVKKDLKEELEVHGIIHSTIEIEAKDSKCDELDCEVKNIKSVTHHHH
jgi:cobalt-zinc-cadmium efflux system protein